MPARRDEAFVLARYPFRERDLVVVMLARAAGQIRVVARRARGVRGGAGAALEPLALVRVSYFERAGRELATLDEAQTVRPSFPLAVEPAAWAAGQVVAELAMVFCPPGQRQEAAFRLVDRSIQALLDRRDPRIVAPYALLWFVRLAGVFPDLDRCGVCGEALTGEGRRFDGREGAFVCAAHRGGPDAVLLSSEDLRWVRHALRSPVEEVTVPPPEDTAGWLVALERRFTERELASWSYYRHVTAEGSQ
jgi:DNA repair protein RecO